MNTAPRYFIHNNRITYDPCPQCGMQAKCEHGTYGNPQRPAHAWECLRCGQLVSFVGYDCAECNPKEE